LVRAQVAVDIGGLDLTHSGRRSSPPPRELIDVFARTGSLG
jgi:hypothetical protein